jgi:hypothetical protein
MTRKPVSRRGDESEWAAIPYLLLSVGETFAISRNIKRRSSSLGWRCEQSQPIARMGASLYCVKSRCYNSCAHSLLRWSLQFTDGNVPRPDLPRGLAVLETEG